MGTSIAVVILVLLLLLVLGVIIRYSIISSWRTRGAESRLRTPDPEGTAEVCGFRPPESLVRMYQEAAFVSKVEFYLVDREPHPPKAWFFGGFTPLTRVDARERLKTTRVDGIPIADDLSKGVYFVIPNGEVLLRSPNLPRDVVVARNAEALSSFEVHEDWQEARE